MTTRTIAADRDMGYDTFAPRVGSAVMGASTWQWLQDAGEETFMDGTPTVVLTHREFPPATLGAGHPLCPAHVELRLLDVVRNGDFVCTRYAVEQSTP